MKVQYVFTKRPEVIRSDASICEAARKMKRLDIGMLPVCDGKRLIGCLTDRDLAIRAVAAACDPLSTKVHTVMTPEVFYCFENDDLNKAAHIMEERQIRRLPVLDGSKRLVGILSLGDLATRTHDEHLVEEVLEHVCEHSQGPTEKTLYENQVITSNRQRGARAKKG